MTRILDTPVRTIMEQSFLDYSMSVITGRALPDIRDGLKPVHRRILYSMHEAGNRHDRPYRKSARTVGDVIGKYHPHGDASVYEAAVRMAQTFSMQTPLIDGQGNFGSIDGDMPAAMRYTEMRLSAIAGEFFADIDKDTVRFQDNYDGTEREPTVLPAPFPNLLVNGVDGIAVGMASTIPPHNLAEVIAATIMLMDRPDAPTDELARILKGPDFPTGALAYGLEGFHQALETGTGRFRLRATWHEENRGRGAKAIVIDQIPYQVNKARLVASIAELVRNKEIDGIVDLRDESSKEGIRIWIALRTGESPETLFAELASKTDLETSISYNCTVLDGGRPRQMGLRDTILRWIDFREEVVLARHVHERNKALKRLHLLEGYMAALGRLDETITLIRQAEEPRQARQELMQLLSIDEEQAQAILDLRLQKLTGMELEGIRADHRTTTALVQDLTAIIESPERIRDIIRNELQNIAQQHGRPRRTDISHETSSITREDLVPREDVLLAMTSDGYVKRMPTSVLRTQNRGTRGKAALAMGDEDTILFFAQVHSHDTLLLFTQSGQAHAIRAYNIPEAAPTSKGRHVRNVIDGLEEDIHAILALPEKDPATTVLTITSQGQVKRTRMEDYSAAIRRGGIKGVVLKDGDTLLAATTVREDDHILMVADNDKAIRFPASNIQITGRVSAGVRGMKIGRNAQVIGAAVLAGGDDSDLDLITIGEHGIGKRTPVSEFPLQARAGSGARAFRSSRRTGRLAIAETVRDQQDIILLSTNGVSNRIRASSVRRSGRATSGVQIMNLDQGARMAKITVVATQPENTEDR